MPVYMITYELHEGENYGNLQDAIKKVGPDWWHCLHSTWLIVHTGPAPIISNALKPYLKNPHQKTGDKLLVARLRGAAWTNSFSSECQDWLRTRLRKA
jgi:hypothetical protein